MNQNFDASMYSIQLETMNSNFEIMNQNIANLQGALQVLFRLTIDSLLARYWLSIGYIGTVQTRHKQRFWFH